MRLLTFTLNEIQLRLVNASLAKLEASHRARVAWFADYSLSVNVLSIHALDLLTVLSHCHRSSENEMELFRLRKAAMDHLSGYLGKTQDEIKRQNLGMWLESYKKLWPGVEADIDLATAPSQPNRIDMIP